LAIVLVISFRVTLQRDMGLNSLGIAIVVKDVEGFFGDVLSYNIPIGVVKAGWEAIRAWGSQTLHIFDGLIHFFSSEILL
jgi:hypothetical protein